VVPEGFTKIAWEENKLAALTNPGSYWTRTLVKNI
jgi:hypothetical protein